MIKKTKLFPYLTIQLWNSNQILVSVLGICSALAITNRLSIAFTMGLSVTFVVCFSSFFVSLLRHKTPDSVRMMVQLAIISVFVTTIDQFLQAYFYSLSKVMTVFVGLIITNCIVMGRTEGMARHVSPSVAFMDGLGAGLGYMLVICFIGAVREFLAFGELGGITVIPLSWYASFEHPDRYENFSIMASPPAAFFILGIMVGVFNFINKKRKTDVAR